MENKPFIAVVCGEIEAEKRKLIDDIRENPDMAFITIINPETDCHPKKQSLSAENYARHISVRHWNVILTTNSFRYLEAFLLYLKKYGVDGNLHFYLVKDGFHTTSREPYNVMKNLSQPTFDLEEEELEYELEPEPVKHGKWVKTLNFRRFNTGETHYIYTCSICDFYTGDQGRFFNYCPNCGAKMDGGDENED